MLTNDNFYPEVKLVVAKDNYCPECGNEKVHKIEENEFYCKKCDSQWSEQSK